MRIVSLLIALMLPAAASAQSFSSSERSAALSQMRALASCLTQSQQDLERVMRLVAEAEQQRSRARDAAARRDAERTVDALIGRAADIQARARECVSAERLPSAQRVIVRDPPPDPSAAAVAERGGTVRTVEQDATLAENVQVVRGEQVDGEGSIDASEIRAAVHRVGAQLQQCYERYLDRGTLATRELDLVFAFRRAGPASNIEIERSGFSDRGVEACIRQAAARMRIRRAPSGGPAIFSYRLRFGQ